MRGLRGGSLGVGAPTYANGAAHHHIPRSLWAWALRWQGPCSPNALSCFHAGPLCSKCSDLNGRVQMPPESENCSAPPPPPLRTLLTPACVCRELNGTTPPGPSCRVLGRG